MKRMERRPGGQAMNILAEMMHDARGIAARGGWKMGGVPASPTRTCSERKYPITPSVLKLQDLMLEHNGRTCRFYYETLGVSSKRISHDMKALRMGGAKINVSRARTPDYTLLAPVIQARNAA